MERHNIAEREAMMETNHDNHKAAEREAMPILTVSMIGDDPVEIIADVDGPNERLIATLSCESGLDNGEKHRFAHLFAAAPELVQALEALCDGASWPLGGEKKHIAEIQAHKIEKARAAIAKAKGEPRP